MLQIGQIQKNVFKEIVVEKNMCQGEKAIKPSGRIKKN